MTLIEKIKTCERKYLECFGKTISQENITRFSDNLIPDMYSHNCTWINSAKNNIALTQIIESEIKNSKSNGKDFCLIHCHIPNDETILSTLSTKPEASTMGCYVFDASHFSKIMGNTECCVLKVDKPEMVNDLLQIDLEFDGEALGIDFCTRRINRKKDVYLSNAGLDSFICFANNEVVGTCDIFFYEDTAKIEDFAVSPKKQGKGYGTAILKKLIEIAISKGISTIYLVTDESDTAKEMYKKLGFYKVYEHTELLFNF